MEDKYESMRQGLLKSLDEIEQNDRYKIEKLQKALDKKLTNSSDETNYDDWLQGSLKFLKDNEELLRSLAK